MLTLLRRFSVIAALMFWQGGFTFYAAVVVPTGQENLGHLEQGFITRDVTNYLNLAGAAALLLLAWDTVETADETRWRVWGRWLTWAGLLGTLAALVWLHPHLDRLLDLEDRRIVSEARSLFRLRHRLYLWLSTAQWTCAVAYLVFTLLAWRAQDSQHLRAGAEGESFLGSR
jgi:hypothetical protein